MLRSFVCRRGRRCPGPSQLGNYYPTYIHPSAEHDQPCSSPGNILVQTPLILDSAVLTCRISQWKYQEYY